MHVRGDVFAAEPLANHTTYRVGGAAEVLVRPASSVEAARCFRYAVTKGIPLTVIGAGSNVIAPDEGLPGVVLEMRRAAPRVRLLGNGRVTAEAGVLLDDLVSETARRGLRGLEHLAGIPGTLGGAVVMNAGTRDTDISERLVSVTVVTGAGRQRTFERQELSYGYRRSAFLGAEWLVVRAVFRLSRGSAKASLSLIASQLAERARKYPLELPSAGSVFRRPPGDYPGRLIEAAGCKGLRVGDAMVSDRHANFIVNVGSAKAADILALIARVRARVFEKTGVYLELEQIPLSPQPRRGAAGSRDGRPDRAS